MTPPSRPSQKLNQAPSHPLHPDQSLLLQAFLESKRLDKGASQNTLDSYTLDLIGFFSTLDPSTSLSQLTQSDLENYLGELASQNLKATSVARKISTLRQFFSFCFLEKKIPLNPAESLILPQREARLPRCLTNDQVNQLLQSTTPGLNYPSPLRDTLQARDRTMLYLLYATGLRVSELLSLTPHELNLNQGYLRVLGKGGKERIAPFAPAAGDLLRSYLLEHRIKLHPQGEEIFLNHRGKKLTRQGFWKTLKLLAQHAGLSVPLTPHLLRHSFATHLLQSGMSLRSLQILLGHSDLATTQIYTQLSPEHLKEAHTRYHPRSQEGQPQEEGPPQKKRREDRFP